jgi:predicted ATPase
MIGSVRIRGFRALKNFGMENLGRINLLVGKNNTAKTSVLEGLYLLVTRGDPAAFWRVMSRRGEFLVSDVTSDRPVRREIDVCHLFFGHGLNVGTRADIATKNEASDRAISFQVREAQRDDNPELFAQEPSELEVGLGPRLAIQIDGTPAPLLPLLPLSSRGGLRAVRFLVSGTLAADVYNHQYISTDSLSVQELQTAFNSISLSPREDRVIRALQFLEPRVERMALAPISSTATRGGIKVKLKGSDEPVPIGSLGEGTWRMLGLAIALSRAANGLLLVDEIDTGFHHTVLTSMWKFVAEAAREFNIQVFATTHSYDCVRSLAAVCREDVRIGSEVTIQRLEVDKERAISYSEAEIIALARDNIESR